MRGQLVVLLALLSGLVLSAYACDDSPDGDADADTDVDTDADADEDAESGPTWTTEVVDSNNVARYTSIDVDGSGNVGVAYYGYDVREGELCDVPGDPITESWHPVYYSSRPAGSKAWSTELVTETLHLDLPTGLSFRFSPSGVPSVGLFGGTTVDLLCSANDAVVATKTAAAWTLETAAANSGDAAVPPGDDCPAEASIKGYAVGSWPALAFDKAGKAALMYRDVHFGGMQRDDIMRADAEVAFRAGGWSSRMVDCGDGGGRDNAAIFDSEDRFVGFHRITQEGNVVDRHGLWAHRLEPDGGWSVWMLARGMVGFQESAAVAGPDGTLAVVYYDATEQHPYVAELEDPALFSDGAGWAHADVGDNRYVEGMYPSIGRHPDGRLGVAYYRCARSGSSGESCADDQDALMFAWRNAAGSWTREVVDTGARGQCGIHTSLAFDPEGVAWISYACVVNVAGSEFVSELKVARRRPL